MQMSDGNVVLAYIYLFLYPSNKQWGCWLLHSSKPLMIKVTLIVTMVYALSQVVEMYSSGGDLHLELPTGQQGGTRKLWVSGSPAFSYVCSWEISHFIFK